MHNLQHKLYKIYKFELSSRPIVQSRSVRSCFFVENSAPSIQQAEASLPRKSMLGPFERIPKSPHLEVRWYEFSG